MAPGSLLAGSCLLLPTYLLNDFDKLCVTAGAEAQQHRRAGSQDYGRSRRRDRQVVGLVVVPPGLVVVAVAATYKGYRYPIEVIGHAVFLYHRFALSLRDVEELMLARGVMLTYETIRSWCAKFGPD